jgi:hypothetical protein
MSLEARMSLTESIAFRVTEQEKERLTAIARQEFRSVGQQVRWIVEQWLRRNQPARILTDTRVPYVTATEETG